MNRREFLKFGGQGLAALLGLPVLAGCGSENADEKTEREMLSHPAPIILEDSERTFYVFPMDFSKTSGQYKASYLGIDCYNHLRMQYDWTCTVLQRNSESNKGIKNPVLASQNKELLVVSMDNYICGLSKTEGKRIWMAQTYQGNAELETMAALNAGDKCDLKFKHAVSALTFSNDGRVLEVIAGKNNLVHQYRFDPHTAKLLSHRG